MIGQSMINVKSGGRTRIAGISAAIFLLIFILYTSNLIELIPIASLVGVMFMVVIGTFAWNSLKLLFVVPRSDALVIVLVTLITVLEDLAVAVVAGVIINALVFAWKSASRIRAIERQSRTEKGAKVYEIEGPLFFSSTNSFLDIFKPAEDPNLVIIDFANSKGFFIELSTWEFAAKLMIKLGLNFFIIFDSSLTFMIDRSIFLNL